MALTDALIRAAKGGEKPVKLSDGGGLHLLVTTKGARLWRMAYRYAGKQKTLAFGSYPAVSLADARRRRDDAKRTLGAGADPSVRARLDKLAKRVAAANTFGAIADEYLAKLEREGRAEATIGKITWLLTFARPSLGTRPIAEISSAEVLPVLQKVENRGHHETARRLRIAIGSVFRHAIVTARAQNDPTTALRGALTTPTVTSRAAILDPQAFGSLLRAIGGFGGQPTTRAALKLMALLFPRPGELRAAAWCEFDFEQGVWTIPAERTKMRRVHFVPLPRQSIAILKDLQELTGSGVLAFPSVRTAKQPISENTLNAALRRLGYSKGEHTSHGFRASASTLLNESGKWNADAIERQLAHVEGNNVRRAYARGAHWDERVRMMQWWADYLDTLKAGGAKVVALHA